MPGQLPATTTDRWQTTQITFDGGLIDNEDELSLAHAKPGSLVQGVNFECGLRGGYRRINGYTQFETTKVPGSGAVLGICVFPDLGVVAARNQNLYFSPGSGGWQKLNSTPTSGFTASINFASFTGSVNSATFTGEIYQTTFNASLAGNTLTVNTKPHGVIILGETLSGTSVTGSPIILAQISGITGGAGTYLVSGPTLTVSAEAMSTSGDILQVHVMTSGSVQIGSVLSGAGVTGTPNLDEQLTGTPNGPGLYLLDSSGLSISTEAMVTSGQTLTVSLMSSGTVSIGDVLSGSGISGSPTILKQISGTPGQEGVYGISGAPINIPSESLTTSSNGNVLTVSAVGSGPIILGSVLSGIGIVGSPVILSQSSGTPGDVGVYLISGPGQRVPSEHMNAQVSARATPGKVRFAHFNYGIEKIIITDGVNAPTTWDGTTLTQLYNFPVGGATYALNFGNTMFVAAGSNLYFSAPADETDWNAEDGAGVINAGFIITGLRSWRGTLYVFGETKISGLTGTVFGGQAPDAVFAPVTLNIGCIAPDSIVEISGDVLYLAADGIRTISGTNRVGDLELAAITDPIHDPFTAFIKQYAFQNFCAASVRTKNTYRLFASNTGSSEAASQGWNVCIRSTSESSTGPSDNWEFFQLLGINCSCIDSGYINETEVVVHGAFSGFVYQQELGINFDGAAIPATIRLPYNGFDDPELRKTFYKIKSNILSDGFSSLTVQLSFDFGTATTNQPMPFNIDTSNGTVSFYGQGVYGTSTYASAANPDFFNYAIGSGLNMALIYSSNDSVSAPYTIRSVVLDYQVNGRR